MRRLCPIPYISFYYYSPCSPGVWRYVTVSSQHPRGDFAGLLREINRLGARRGRGEHKLRVSASMLGSRQRSDEMVIKKQEEDPSLLHSTTQKETARKSQTPVVIAEPPTTYTDIACTLQELEGALFQLAGNGSPETDNHQNSMQCKNTVEEKSNIDTGKKLSETLEEPHHNPSGEHLSEEEEESSHDQNLMRKTECHDELSCWLDNENVLDPSENDTVLHNLYPNRIQKKI
ncbi:hypothetical protein LSM04_001362 [Trypanosoma melophagium]|uniref:uncharacterized protein n=1 Tax=Trypanosoma melophagium TaxID=715481 RepID=UPI00351A7AFA|nr:hypothetical protein LSM04_001362 [Trypanosoma melophagium]